MTLFHARARFNSHVENCLGPDVVTYKFNPHNVISYSNEIHKSAVHPFTIYYDLETTCGQNGRTMKTITYVISLSFSDDIRKAEPSLQNSYICRLFLDTVDKLSEYMLPEVP